MKSFILLLFWIIILVLGCPTDQSDEVVKLKEEIANLRAIIGPPPSSLDNLYPPKAEAPIYLLKMFELNRSFSGIIIDFSENELEFVNAHYQKFKTQYMEISKLVPEWEKAYPLEPLEELGIVLGSGDQEKVMTAFGKIGKVCHDCHIATMPKVQQKYHWDKFAVISVTDPVTDIEVDFKQLMQHLGTSFEGIVVDLEQGQLKNAVKNFEAFNGRFQAMKETCRACHETERKYYVDQNLQVLVEKLGATLKSSSPDPKMVGELSQKIGMESCLKCHWVHVPASFTMVRWKEWGKIESVR